jgi:hypothetical protein
MSRCHPVALACGLAFLGAALPLACLDDADDPRPPARGGDDGDALDDDDGGGGDGVGDDDVEAVALPFAAPMRMLTTVEYENSIAAALGEGARAALRPWRQDRARAVWTALNRNLTASGEGVETLEHNAWAAAAAALAATPLPAVLACAQGARDTLREADIVACREGAQAALAGQLWRRPLRDDERARLTALDGVVRDGVRVERATSAPTRVEVDERLAAGVAAILQAPDFVYVNERGVPRADDPTRCALTPDELATRLALLLTTAMPDQTLREAAAAGVLGDDDELALQVDRLLGRDQGRFAFELYADDLLELWRLDAVSTAGTPAGIDGALLKAAAAQEARTLVRSVAQGGDDLRSIFVTDRYLPDPSLSLLYGASGTGPTAALPDDARGGVLGRAAFLMAHNGIATPSIVLRGKYVREVVLCGHIDAPPPGLDIFEENQNLADALPPGHTARDVAEARLETRSCRGCHDQMDPLAFPFERYGAFGEERPVYDDGVSLDEDGLPIDEGDPAATSIDGAGSMGAWLAQRDDVARCLAERFVRQGFGQEVREEQRPTATALAATFVESGHDARALLRALALSPAFREVECRP